MGEGRVRALRQHLAKAPRRRTAASQPLSPRLGTTANSGLQNPLPFASNGRGKGEGSSPGLAPSISAKASRQRKLSGAFAAIRNHRLIEFSNRKIPGLDDFDLALRRVSAGDTVEITALRAGKPVKLKVTLGVPR